MFLRSAALLAVSLLALSSSACTYLSDRGRDLMDVAGFEVITGVQIGASVRASKIAQAGLAFSSGDVASWDGRALGCYEENRGEGGLGPFYANAADRHLYHGNKGYEQKDYFDQFEEETFDLARGFDRGFFEVGARVHAGIIGVGAFFDPVEAGDFILGLIGLDFARDDARNIEKFDHPPGFGWPRLRKDEMEDEAP